MSFQQTGAGRNPHNSVPSAGGAMTAAVDALTQLFEIGGIEQIGRRARHRGRISEPGVAIAVGEVHRLGELVQAGGAAGGRSAKAQWAGCSELVRAREPGEP